MAQSKKLRKVMKVLGGIFFAVIILLMIGVLTFSIISKNEKKVHFIGNVALVRILSPSMEPSFTTGDYIMIKKVDPSLLKEGDIITFISSDPDIKGMLNTHQIIQVVGDSFVTKGLANSDADLYRVNRQDVIGIYIKKLTFLGGLFRLLSSFQGFVLFILIPILVVIGLYIRDFVVSVKQIKKEEDIDKEKELVLSTLEEMKNSGELQQRLEQLEKDQNQRK